MARAVGVGPSGRRLEFKFGSRGDLDSVRIASPTFVCSLDGKPLF